MRRRGVAALVTAAGAALVVWRRMDPADPGRFDDGADADGRSPEPQVLRRLAEWVPQRPAGVLGRTAAYVWAAPLTAVGVVLGVVSGGRPRLVDGVVLFAGARGVAGAVLRRRGFSGTTLGHAIVVTPRDPDARLIAHELVHTRQAERLGLLFGPVYVALLARYGYRRHPLERAARVGAGG